MKKITLLFAIAMFSLIGNATLYVVPGGSGTADGSSWENAFGSIQSAVDAASTLYSTTTTPQEVWVKAGTYSTSTAALLMKENVSLFGGFGGTETDKNQRIIGTNAWDYSNATILDGGATKRCIEVASNFTNLTIIDGFTITNGNGVGAQLSNNGGGVLLRANLKLQNSIVTGNTASGNGGGVNAAAGIISNCWIYNNTTTSATIPAAGGVYSAPAAGLNTIIENTLIERNTQGGIRLQGAGTISMDKCIVRNNSSTGNGGAIYLNNPTNCVISNSLITNNTGSSSVYLNKGKLINSTIANNEGNIYLASATNISELYNNLIVNNVVKATTTPTSIGVATGYPTGKVKNNATWPSVAFQIWGDATDSILTVDAENALTQVGFKSPTSFRGRVLANADSLNLIASADWTLTTSSICLEKGDNTFIPSGIVKDLAGNTRIENTNVDLGAYELPNSITTGLLNEITTLKCIGKNNSIEIQGLTAGETASVYALTGSLVTLKKSNASTLKIDLPTGLYIVKVGEKVNKVIVK